jgi:hypothetical protein
MLFASRNDVEVWHRHHGLFAENQEPLGIEISPGLDFPFLADGRLHDCLNAAIQIESNAGHDADEARRHVAYLKTEQLQLFFHCLSPFGFTFTRLSMR